MSEIQKHATSEKDLLSSAMPKPTLPPTPAPSTDIKGQQSSSIDHTDPNFVLPPSAVRDDSRNADSAARSQDIKTVTGAALTPASSSEQPYAEPSMQSQTTGRPEVALPPPPSRSRKIIQVQMKPKLQEKSRSSNSSQPRRSARAAESQTADKSVTSDAQGAAISSNSGTTGKKAGGSNTAAGRKVARKTAHSIIERRRRSKMNEEFGILKDLIPACRGYEMHKLAILQASIDYLRYLERCVSELKANQRDSGGPSMVAASPADSSERKTPADASTSNEDSEQGDSEQEKENDNENDMEVDEPEHKHDQSRERESEAEAEAGHPWLNSIYRNSPVSSISGNTAITSPAFSAYSQSRHRPSTATLPSPIFGPIWSHDERHRSYSGGQASYNNSTQTSPSIVPMNQSFEQSEDMNEASAALLMLNAKDRRNQASVSSAVPPTKPAERPSGHRGMSVKDLLRS